MEKNSKIFVAGHRGLVGSAIVRKLKSIGFNQLVLKTSSELDLRNQVAVSDFFAGEKPEYVFLAAAKVGGIYANDTYAAEFIRDNLLIQANVIDSAWKNGVKRLLFLGSSCIYPKFAPQPMSEECLLTGPLESTNQWYAVAKIAGIKMCQAYRKQYGFDAISAMPTNLYGPDDNYDLQNSHVLPALIRKFHLAKLAGDGNIEAIIADEQRHGIIPDDVLGNLGLGRHEGCIIVDSGSDKPVKVVLWGSGSPYREFLHVDDMAEACLFLMNSKQAEENSDNSNLYNIGVGQDITIKTLSELVQDIVGFDGETVWDSSKPDGTPRKLMDVSKINAMGWQAKIALQEGIRSAYESYRMTVGVR